jgi:hypothetical protein
MLSLETLWQAIHDSAVATVVREEMWVYPILETVHIVGIAFVFGSILAYDLRVLGANKVLPLGPLGRHLLPWVWTGFAMNAVSGVLLFASDAMEFAANPALQAKLALIGLAGLNAFVFQRRYAAAAPQWNEATRPPMLARLSAIVSIVIWLAIIAAGRMMAYVK